jgi:hypothetical protein
MEPRGRRHRGDGSVGGTSGDGGMTKKRRWWLRWRDEEEARVAAMASHGRDGGEPRAADGGSTVASQGRDGGEPRTANGGWR